MCGRIVGIGINGSTLYYSQYGSYRGPPQGLAHSNWSVVGRPTAVSDLIKENWEEGCSASQKKNKIGFNVMDLRAKLSCTGGRIAWETWLRHTQDDEWGLSNRGNLLRQFWQGWFLVTRLVCGLTFWRMSPQSPKRYEMRCRGQWVAYFFRRSSI